MNPSTRLHFRKICIGIFTIAFFTTGCHYLHHEEKQDIQYVPLNEYKYTPAKVDAGTATRVIAFSGGNYNDKDNIYYCQFITINSSNGDTVRVLASLISFDTPNGDVSKMHTLAAMYDGRKEITDAVFVPEDSTSTLMLNSTANIEAEAKKGQQNSNVDDLYKIDRPRLVAINKSLPMLQTPSYKTVVGVLNFKQQPW